MRDSFDAYPEQALNLMKTREGHGTLLLTESLRVLFGDSRARSLCEQIQSGERQNSQDTLPVSLVKMCEEIKDLLQLRSHPKDWEGFAVKRVLGPSRRQIFVCGIGLPAGMVGEEAGILLTLDYIGTRARPPLPQAMAQYHLSRRQVMVVENLLMGRTNKEIANELNITTQTAKQHLKNIMEKTRTTTRTAILSSLAGFDSLSPHHSFKSTSL